MPWFSTRGQILQTIGAVCSATCAVVLLADHFWPSSVPDWLYDVGWVALGIIIGVLAGLVGRRAGSGDSDKIGARACDALALVEQAGLNGAFETRHEASKAIENAVANAKKVWVLSNMGTDWVGDDGILTRPLKERWARGEHVRLRILLLSPRSPWLKGRANEKGWSGNCPDAVLSFGLAHEKVLRFAAEPDVEGVKFQKFDPSWRFVMTDREIFLQTYNTIAQVSDERVLHFTKESTVYRSAERFFDYIYDLDSAEKDELSVIEALRQKPIVQRVSSGCVVTRTRNGNVEALMLVKDDMIALPKGGIEQLESSPKAALRELEEETGANVSGILVDDLVFLHWAAALQADADILMVKGIVFYHYHLADGAELGSLKSNVHWYGERALDGKCWRYDYVPNVLSRVGIQPAWGTYKYR